MNFWGFLPPKPSGDPWRPSLETSLREIRLTNEDSQYHIFTETKEKGHAGDTGSPRFRPLGMDCCLELSFILSYLMIYLVLQLPLFCCGVYSNTQICYQDSHYFLLCLIFLSLVFIKS